MISTIAAAIAMLAGSVAPQPERATSGAGKQLIVAEQPKPTRPIRPNIPAGVRVIPDIVYATVDGHNLELDLYLPTSPPSPPSSPATPPSPGASETPADAQLVAATPQSLRPVILWIHGGAWEGGDKNDCPAAQFVPHGYAAVSVGYRLTHLAPFPAQIHDCKAAVRWVRANASTYNLDPDRIGVWGASAGGHLAALLGTSAGIQELDGELGEHTTHSTKVQAVCDWFGPTDLVKLCRNFIAMSQSKQEKDIFDVDGKINGAYPETPSIFRKLLGGEIQDKPALAASANPITHVDESDATFLIMHGDKDTLVPLVQSEELVTSLEKAKVQVKLEVIRNAGHGFWSADVFDKMLSFFNKTLKAPPAATAE